MSTDSKMGPPLLGALMRRPVDLIRRRMLADLHRAGFSDLVPAHFAVLRYPGPDGRRPSDLADDAGMSRQSMNYLLSELERLGYLTRKPDGGDGRARRVRITPRGAATFKTIRASVAAIEGELIRQMGPRRFAQLRELLITLNACDIASG